MSLDGYVLISNVIKYSFTLRLLFGYLSRKGSLSCHTCRDTWPRVLRSHQKDRQIQSPLTTKRGKYRLNSSILIPRKRHQFIKHAMVQVKLYENAFICLTLFQHCLSLQPIRNTSAKLRLRPDVEYGISRGLLNGKIWCKYNQFPCYYHTHKRYRQHLELIKK